MKILPSGGFNRGAGFVQETQATPTITQGLAASHTNYSLGLVSAPNALPSDSNNLIQLIPHSPIPQNMQQALGLQPVPAVSPTGLGPIDPATGIPYSVELQQAQYGGGSYGGGDDGGTDYPENEDDGQMDDLTDDSNFGPVDDANVPDEFLGLSGTLPTKGHNATIAVKAKMANANLPAKIAALKAKAKQTAAALAASKSKLASAPTSKRVAARAALRGLSADPLQDIAMVLDPLGLFKQFETALGDATSDALSSIDNQMQALQTQYQNLVGQDAQLTSDVQAGPVATILNMDPTQARLIGVDINATWAQVNAEDQSLQAAAISVSNQIDALNGVVNNVNQSLGNLQQQAQQYSAGIQQAAAYQSGMLPGSQYDPNAVANAQQQNQYNAQSYGAQYTPQYDPSQYYTPPPVYQQPQYATGGGGTQYYQGTVPDAFETDDMSDFSDTGLSDEEGFSD